ncbi:MAG: tetratricopeptide repeat protein, partial [Candidatus Heimdallarchaeota archaeon]|nr:tetratricopeptide repeat protein [Candidatus Heimdallarchaeota archaeon]
MKAEMFELPNEFSKYEILIQEDFENFYSVYQKYQYQNNTFFQSIVYACDDLAISNKTLEKYRTAYTEISLHGYFLLSQYKQVLTFMVRNNSFETNYFRFKAAIITGERGIISAILANIMTALVELKKKDPKTHKVFFTIMSLEIAAMNSDVDSVIKYAVKIREMLFNTVMIQDYPLVTLQIVSDLAYREFRTGDESYEGWLEIYKELAEALNMDTKRLDCYTMLGGLYRFKGFLEDASEYYNKAFEIAEKVGNKEYKASLISNMADLEHTLGNLEKALLLCNNALKDPELSQSKPNLYINKAEILIKQEKYSEAITNLKKVEQLSNRLAPIVNILYGYALTRLPGKKFLHEGMKHLEKGGHLSDKLKNQRWLATYYYYMGRTYLDNYDLSSSINAFEKCYDYAIRSEFQFVVLSQLFLAESYLHRYKISQSDNDLTYSERYLANVISICQEQELPILSDVLYLKGQLLVALGEYADAYSVFRQTKEIALKNDNSLLAISCEKNIEMLDSDSIDRSTLITSEITEV